MFKKYKQIKSSPNKLNLDQVLWFIENYLPQKKDRGFRKKLYMDNLEAETIKIFSKLASTRSKTLLSTTKNGEVTPYRRSVFEERIRKTQKEIEFKDSKN